jgi:hypothetical protein
MIWPIQNYSDQESENEDARRRRRRLVNHYACIWSEKGRMKKSGEAAKYAALRI